MMAFASTVEAMRHFELRHGDCSFRCFYTLMGVCICYTIEAGRPVPVLIIRGRLRYEGRVYAD